MPSLATLPLRLIDPEKAHRLTIAALAMVPGSDVVPVDPRLAVSVAGLDFVHPVGLAAGFDKDARAAHAMARFGFAAAEVGTLTPLPQPGNPLPRLFRLTADRAVINRMGFNNGGQAAAMARIARMRVQVQVRARPIPIGINIGANKDSMVDPVRRIGDYVAGVRTMAGLADWLTVNISSPNTPGLRALQDEGALDNLLAAIADARIAGGPPVFLKVAPDLDDDQIDGIVRSAMAHGVDALIVGNTTLSRPPLQSAGAGETGGLSGAPLAALALEKLRAFRSATGGAVPLIAAGGIASAADAWERIVAGAALVQIYSALVYEGPWLARRIAAGLLDRLDRSGFATLQEAIGSERAPD
jgi:dihydroorotate dehydrogenase